VWLPPFYRCPFVVASASMESALTPQPFERKAYPRVGHRNLISYMHVGCISMELHTDNAINCLHMPRLLGVACSVACCLRPGKVSTLARYPSARDSSTQRFEDLDKFDLHPVSSPLAGNIRLLDSMVPSMIVIGVQGSQTPRHEPTPESIVCGPRRSLRLHFPHRLQRPMAKTSISLHSLPSSQSIGTRF
jgi:hypothetical protein